MSITHNEKTTLLQALFYVGIWAILCPFSAYGQGLITSTAVDTTPPQYFELLEKGGTSLPRKFSLRQYCPKPDDQGYLKTCVAFACGHAAMTITKQIKFTKENIKDNPYSAGYICRNIKMNEGVEFKEVLDFMKKDGVYRVDNVGLTEAVKENKIEWDKLFTKNQKNLHYPNVLMTLKKVIADSLPIILGVNIINNDFQKLKGKTTKWQLPAAIKDTIKHAMVIVGYDDDLKTFDLMNSRGIGWGNGGFIQLSYADFKRVFECAYIIGKRGDRSKGEGTTDSLAAMIDSTITAGIGTFELKIRENTDNPDPFHAQNIQINEESAESAYETKERLALHSQFKLHVTDIPPSKKLYVFSLDPVGVVTIHEQPDTSLEPKNQPTPTDRLWVIPPKNDRVIGVHYKGKDQIIILVSDSIITNFQQQLDVFRTKKGTAQARLEATFGDALMPKTGIEYMKSDDTKMYVKSRVLHAAKQRIVPIVLDIRVGD